MFSFLSEKPQKWKVEISGGQKKVKTVWQLSDSAPVDHLSFHKSGKDGLSSIQINSSNGRETESLLAQYESSHVQF